MPDPKVEEARQMADLGQFQEALALLQSALRDNPQDVEAQGLIEEVQVRQQLEAQVQEKLATVQALIDEGQQEYAKKILQEILRVSPGHPEATILLRGLSTETPVITDTYPGLPSQPAPPPPAEASGFDLEPAFFDSAEPPAMTPAEATNPSPRPSQAAAAPQPQAEAFSFETPGDSPTSQNGMFSLMENELGPDELAKVQQYIREGQAHYDQGSYQEAIDAWTRVFIIDENNLEVPALIEKAKASLNDHSTQIDHFMTEGVTAFNSGDFVRCRELMQKVLSIFPHNSEANHFLMAAEDGERAAAEKAQALPPAPQAAEHSEMPGATAGTADDFELEDDLTAPTGPEMRSGQPAAGEFQFESGGDEMSFASVNPSSPAAGQPPQDFVWEEPAAPEPAPSQAPAAPAASAPADAPAAATALSTPAFAQTAPPMAEPGPPTSLPEAPTGETPVAAQRQMAAKKAGRAPGVGMVLGAIAAMVVLGVGIFLGARFFLNKPATTVQSTTPGPNPKPPGPKNAAPDAVAKPGQPTEPGLSPKAISPEDEAKTLGTDQLLAKARDASAAKDHKTAVLFYQEVLSRDAGNSAATQGLEAARVAQHKQDEENARNEKFLKSYQSALSSFQEQDYASCLGVAWRLVYPDDTLARQLGKRDAVTRLIRNGYYNWALQDLRSGNQREAESKLKDLLDFDRSDAEAQKLYQLVRKYRTQAPDESYQQAVKGLAYRTFTESP